VESSRPIGSAWLLDRLWAQLDIGNALADVLGPRRFRTDIERVIFALVANRAIAPASKLAATEWVATSVMIPGLDGMDKDQAMRAMDLLVTAAARGKVSEAVFFAAAQLLNLEVDLISFDTTSTYFERDDEPAADENDEQGLRRYGQSKDHRKDLPQIVIGLAVTREGIPVQCWVWPGNTAHVRDRAGQERSGRLAARPRGHRRRLRVLLPRQHGLSAARRRPLHHRREDA
jgi:hypothetical protein